MTPSDLIKQYVLLRDKRDRMAAEHEAATKPYADAMQTIEGSLQAHLLEHKLDNVKCEFGTAFFKTATRVRCADRGAFNEFVAKQGDLSYFTNAVAKEMIVDYVKANDAPPPGIDITYVTEVQIRRGSQ